MSGASRLIFTKQFKEYKFGGGGEVVGGRGWGGGGGGEKVRGKGVGLFYWNSNSSRILLLLQCYLFFFCKFLHRRSFHRIKWNSVESNLLLVSFSWNIWLQKSFFLIKSGFYVAHFSEKFYLFSLLFLRSPTISTI